MTEVTGVRPTVVNVRLPKQLVSDLDKWLEARYAPLPAPSRSAVLEQWIREGWERVKGGDKG